jgi:hypothetical protein
VFLASRVRTLGLIAGAGACAVAACATTAATTTYTPITGIEIPSAALVSGFGCGTGQTQVYRYAAALSYGEDAGTEPSATPDAEAGRPDAQVGVRDDAEAGATDAEAGATDAEAGATDAEAGVPGTEVGAPEVTRVPVEQNGVPLTNIFDCFADGVFENLPSSDAGSQTFVVTIFAYTKDSYDDAGLPANLGCPPALDGGQCTPASEPLTSAQESMAPWTTVCTATQQQGTPVVAVCAPLESPATGIETDGSAPAAPDGGVDAGS